MTDFYGLKVKIGEIVLYSNVKGGFTRGIITDIVDDKAKLKGVVKRRRSNEIISETPYLEWIQAHPEFLI